jgi:hypothetical protein
MFRGSIPRRPAWNPTRRASRRLVTTQVDDVLPAPPLSKLTIRRDVVAGSRVAFFPTPATMS